MKWHEMEIHKVAQSLEEAKIMPEMPDEYYDDYDFEEPDYEAEYYEQNRVDGYCPIDGHKTGCTFCFQHDRIACELSMMDNGEL